ncbi:MAG: S41 family peptidase [Bacteroidota bacterium]
MKSLLIIVTLVSCLTVSLQAQAQNLTQTDSIHIFSDSLFQALKARYLKKAAVSNWDEIQVRFEEEASTYPNFAEALQASRNVFDSIGCSHCMLFFGEQHYPASQRPLLYEDYSEQFVRKYQSGTPFSVSLLDNQYGYILLPGMLFLDLPKDSLNLKAQKMYDQIIELDKEHELKGWIIDLRFNIGGDAYLMLAALYHFLGDKIVYKELDVERETVALNQLKDGKFYSGEDLKMELSSFGQSDLRTPVALITGNWTASAGECVLLGFTGRENVIRIGEPSYGFTTGNGLFELPFQVKAPLTTCYMADMNGNYSENFQPNIFIKQKDNFDDLMEDQNIMEAIKFIESKVE